MDTPNSNDPLLVSFGVDAATGDYLAHAVSPEKLAATAAASKTIDKVEKHTTEKRFFGNMGDLDETKWGIIFAAGEDAAVRQALQPLIDHRFCPPEHIFTYNPGESYNDWIRRNGGEPGSANPEVVPFYLCLIGGPDKIPFDFQFGLDIEYGVGRLAFDAPADYAQYIQNVIAYEDPTSEPTNRKQVVMMGSANPGDNATKLSSQFLITPLTSVPAKFGYGLSTYLAPDFAAGRSDVAGPMSKANMVQFFGQPNNQLPALLVTASHGWGYTRPDPNQRATQGAIVTQDWPTRGNDPAFFFAAADIPASADLRGMVMFSFACYGAGTPKMSYYKRLWGGGAESQAANTPIADADFIAALPKKLMARPNGILGFFGHIEQTWAHSFVHQQSGKLTTDLIAFEMALQRILKHGFPLGCAIENFNDRNAALTPEVSDLIEARLSNKPVNDAALSGKWIDRNDARSLIYLGDPAVRLRISELKA